MGVRGAICLKLGGLNTIEKAWEWAFDVVGKKATPN